MDVWLMDVWLVDESSCEESGSALFLFPNFSRLVVFAIFGLISKLFLI